jgi:hypothetical protein
MKRRLSIGHCAAVVCCRCSVVVSLLGFANAGVGILVTPLMTP